MRSLAALSVVVLFEGVHALHFKTNGNHSLPMPFGEKQDILCFLKQRLEDYYELDPTPQCLQAARRPSCAVVSNSGAMLERRLGPEIDGHGVVFRFNDGPTAGFEEHVGSKTTFRFGWNTCNAAGHCKTSGALSDAPAIWPSAFAGFYPKAVKQAHQDVMAELYRGARPTGEDPHNPTTGFYGMLLALSHCAEVDAYEMAPSDAAANAQYSYYRPGSPGGAVAPPSQHGLFDEEHDLWARLSLAGGDVRRHEGKTSYRGFQEISCPAGASRAAPRLARCNATAHAAQ